MQAEQTHTEYSLVDKRIPTYDELIGKPDIKVIDIRDNRGEFRERQKALLNKGVSSAVNTDTGEKIFVTKKTFTHSFSNSEVERTAAAEKINDIIENAVLTHKESSYKAGDNSTGVYTFFGAVLTDEGIKPVKLKVKEYTLSRQDIPHGVSKSLQLGDDTYATAYDSRVMVLDEIEKKMHPVTAATMPAKAGVNYPSASSTIRVADLLDLVNSEYTKYLPEKTDAISQGKTTNGVQGIDYSNTIYSDALKRRSIEMAQNIADKQGVKLSFESLGGNIRGKYENGGITLNSDRSDPVMEVFVHELTHHLESSGNYDSLRNAALSYISENLGADVEAMKADVISEYAEGGIELDDAGAERELVAQFCGEMLFADEESIIRLARIDRNLAQRIYDWICDTISKIGKNADARALINARCMYENALRTVGDTQGEGANAKYSISSSFNAEFDRWLKNGKPDRQQITVGTTSDALKSIGVDDKVIKWDTSKINKIQREHLGMSDGVIRQVPNIIENPILVMESKTQPNRLTMFGEVYNDNGLPVMAVLELRPTSHNNYELDQIKVANAYSKDLGRLDAGSEGTQYIIDTSEILYIEPDKKRTDTWLSRNQLHLPLGIDRYGPIGSIALVSRDSQGNFSADSKLQEIPEWKKKLQSFDAQASYGSSLAERAERLATQTQVNGKADGETSPLHSANPKSENQIPMDKFLYTEALMRKAEREGKIYTQRLLQRQIEKAMQNSRKTEIESSTPMPTIYADYIREHNMLEDYEDADSLNVYLENDANSDTMFAGAITDCFDRKVGIASAEEDLIEVNPNYAQKSYEWTNNCQRCVPAYEMRRRGFKVVARPLPGKVLDDILANNAIAAWKRQERVWCIKGNGLQQIKEQMSKWGNGARAEVSVAWRDDYPHFHGHVFIAEQRNGRTVFMDPQTGDSDCSRYFDMVVRGRTSMWRIDDNTPSDLILECCMNEGAKK